MKNNQNKIHILNFILKKVHLVDYKNHNINIYFISDSL